MGIAMAIRINLVIKIRTASLDKKLSATMQKADFCISFLPFVYSTSQNLAIPSGPVALNI
jgi:hypothetical protein